MKNLSVRQWDIARIKENGLVLRKLKMLGLKHNALPKGVKKKVRNNLWAKRMLIWGLSLSIIFVLKRL